MTDLLSAARDYVARGISVIPLYGPDEPAGEPVDRRGKRPAISSWKEYQGRLATDAELVEWFDKKPRNIGIVTGELSGFTVVDFDTQEAIASAKGKGFPKGPLSKTAKGIHALCRYEEGHRNFQKRADLPGIDLRAEGGYIVAPPSIHATGATYQWMKGRGLDYPLPAVPDWLLVKNNTGKATIEELHTTTPEGRNNSLARLCGVWIHQHPGIDLAGLIELATAWNAGLTSSPLPADEVERTCQSIFGKNQKEVNNQWPAPLPLPADLLPVEPFDCDLLPGGAIRNWIADICERMQCPPDFVAVGVMVSLAAVIGRKIGMRPKRHDDWTVTPNLWGMIVGRPGILKSPALGEARAPLKRLAAIAEQSFNEAFSVYQSELKATKMRAELDEKSAKKALEKDRSADVSALLAVSESGESEPTLRRYVSNDPTPAALGELHRQSPNGLLVNRDELVSLLKSLDREDNAEGRGFYLTGWNGDEPYTFDRIGRGLNLKIPAVCLSLLGGTQPGKIAEYVRHANKGGTGDDGLIQRFGLMVWPDVGKEWKDVDRYPNTEQKNAALEVFDYLDKLDPFEIGAKQDKNFDGDPDGVPYLRFDRDAHELFLEWRTELERRLRSDELHPAMESHLAKYRKLVPSLALLIHLAEGRTGDVGESAILKALAWAEYLESHARRVYGSLTSRGSATAKKIVAKIKSGDLKDGFSSKDVWRPGWSGLSDAAEVAEGLRLLVDYEWLRDDHNLETGGRPSIRYQINPGVRDGKVS